MTVKTYNPKNTTIVIGTHTVKDYDDGQFINVEFESDSYEHLSSADGNGVRIATNDGRATATLTLMQGSDSIPFLEGLRLLDKISDSGVVPFMLKDTRNGDLIATESCWIKKKPAYARGKSKEATVYMISLDNPDMLLTQGV